MFEDLKKSIDKGIDFAFMNAEKLAKAATDMAKENKLTKEEAKKLYEHLVKKSEEARKSIEDDLQLAVKNTLKKMNIPTRDDIKKLEDRIKKLESVKKAPAKVKPAPKVVKSTKTKEKK
ncbi:MAG: phasin family protein [Bacteroidales bacterium]